MILAPRPPRTHPKLAICIQNPTSITVRWHIWLLICMYTPYVEAQPKLTTPTKPTTESLFPRSLHAPPQQLPINTTTPPNSYSLHSFKRTPFPHLIIFNNGETHKYHCLLRGGFAGCRCLRPPHHHHHRRSGRWQPKAAGEVPPDEGARGDRQLCPVSVAAEQVCFADARNWQPKKERRTCLWRVLQWAEECGWGMQVRTAGGNCYGGAEESTRPRRKADASES